MPECKHQVLTCLEPRPAAKVRCKHCHLVISADEVKDNLCPECLETKGRRSRDFEPVEIKVPRVVQYRCDQCGMMVMAGPQT